MRFWLSNALIHTITLSMCKRNSAVFGFVEYNSHILRKDLAPFLSFFLFLSPPFSFSGITKVPEISQKFQRKNTKKSSNVFSWNVFGTSVTWVSFSFFLLFLPSYLLLVPFLSFFLLLWPLLLYSRKPGHSRVLYAYLYAWAYSDYSV